MEIEAFVAGVQDRLYRTAFLMTGNHDDAQDAVQEALAVVVHRWPRLVRGDDLGGYAHRVMTRYVWRRAARLRGESDRAAQCATEDADSTHSDQVEDRSFLAPALADLPPRMRAVLVLRFYADMTEKQAAEALGCSVGSVKSQTSRGLARLRDALTATGDHA